MRSVLLSFFALTFAGCGLLIDTSPPDPDAGPTVPPGAVDCTKDEECDDGIDCTVDRCLVATDAGGPHGCYSVPHDDLCENPVSSVACAKLVCVPSATWDSSGCAVAPQFGACGTDGRCNLETLECESLPTSCDACDDGNPCNGVEGCAAGADAECVRMTLGCGEPNDTCIQQVCDTRSDVHACVGRHDPSPVCVGVSP